VKPISYQRGEQVVDKVGSHPVYLFPHRIGGLVGAWGRRWRGAGQSPAHFLSCQGRAVSEGKQNGVDGPGRFAREEMIKEGFV